MTPPHARTWSRRGHTPVIRVRGRSYRRISVAAMACYRPGERSRPIYRPRVYRKGERSSFDWTDYRDLIACTHQQLGGPTILIWDNLNTHRTTGIRQYADDHDWLTIVHLPTYTPDLNPVEGIWSLPRRGPLANAAFTDADRLTRTLRRGLRQIQYRPSLLDGCLAEAILTLNTHQPTPTRKPQ
ncbi:transposase [Streptomyces sp. NBRC 110611]|uniref:transposase n=1 Tax=Streptomyces sp. NBRC 110611 TaxID=1621259 RepID=UPI00215CFE8E|nr:transposase [Streptomyces sp. NBRC 110611]